MKNHSHVNMTEETGNEGDQNITKCPSSSYSLMFSQSSSRQQHYIMW